MGGQPSPLRILAACAAASAAAASPTLILGFLALFAFPIAFMVAGGHMLLLGLPAYLVMRRYRAVDWSEALMAGFVIGFLPITFWNVLLFATDPEVGFFWAYSAFGGVFGWLAGAAFRAVIGAPVDPRFDREVAGIFK